MPLRAYFLWADSGKIYIINRISKVYCLSDS